MIKPRSQTSLRIFLLPYGSFGRYDFFQDVVWFSGLNFLLPYGSFAVTTKRLYTPCMLVVYCFLLPYGSFVFVCLDCSSFVSTVSFYSLMGVSTLIPYNLVLGVNHELSTPLWEFPIREFVADAMYLGESFYSLMGVSRSSPRVV